MNDPVLDVVMTELIDADFHKCWKPDSTPDYQALALAAIAALDRARAEAVREAVRALELDAQRYGVFPSPQGGLRLRASRAALLRLVGAEDSE